MRKWIKVLGGALSVALGVACASSPSSDTPPPRVPLKFTVVVSVKVAVAYDAGDGTKYIDSVSAPGDSWSAGADVGATVSLRANPAIRGGQGRISVKIENASSGKLICHSTNFDKTTAGTSCDGRAK